MQKKNVILLIVSMLLLAKLGMTQNPTPRQENQTLWRISGNDLASPSYLLVTLYSQDKRAFEFSDSTIWAFDQSEAFAVIIDQDSFETAIFDQYFNEKGPNKTLMHVLTEAQYRNVSRKLFERTGHTLDQTQISNPALLSSLLYDAPSGYGNSDYSIRPQEYFMRTAKAKSKKILSLESLHDLVSMNLYTESEISDILLIPPYPEYYYSQEQRSADSAYNEYIFKMYAEGNIEGIQQKLMMIKSAQRELSAHNRIIFNNLQHEIALRSVFVCLDVSSAAGPDGVLSLLKAYGYNLEAVTATYTGVADSYEYKPNNIPWVQLSSDKYGYEVDFPTKVKNRNSGAKINDFYKVFDDGANLSYYMLSTRQATNRLSTDEELLSEFIENDPVLSKYKDNLNSKKISKNYNNQTINGIELDVKDNQRTRRASRVQIFVRDKQYFYILIAESYEKNGSIGKNADRFFKSFAFKELPKVELAQDWKTIVLKDLSFSFASLGEPDTKEQLYEPTDSSSGKSITYTFFDKDGCSYYLRSNNPGKNNPDNRYSVYEFENSLSYRKGIKIISQSDLKDSIFVGKEYIIDEGINNSIIRLFYRGGRSYIMMIQHPKEGYDSMRIKHFINSFQFLPHPAVELTLYSAADKEYSLLLPQKPEEEKPKYNKGNVEVVDPKSGIQISINKEKISQYKHYPNEDSLRVEISNRFTEYVDTVFSCDTLSNYAPYDAYEWTIRPKASFGIERIRVIYLGNVIYTLSALVAPFDLNSPLVDTIFNSFKFKNATPNPRPILLERDSIIANFFKELPVPTTEYEAKLAFRRFPFVASDFPYFRKAIEALTEKDSFAFTLFNVYFNALPKDTDIRELIPFLTKAYNADYIEKKTIKMAILGLLSRYPNAETKACFKELIFKNAAAPLNEFKLPMAYVYNSPLGAYEITYIKEAGFLFPEIFTLLNKDNTQPWMLSFFSNALDSALISIADLNSYLPDFERQFLKQSESLLKVTEEMDFRQQNAVNELLLVLKHLQKPSAKMQKRLKELLESKNENISYFFKLQVIEALLMYKTEPSQKLIKELCKDDKANTYRIYRLYKEKAAEKLFPKSCLLNQEEMAKAKLQLMSEANEFGIGELVLVAKEKVELNGKTGVVYVFKMTNNWGYHDEESDKKWHLAAVGFYSDEQDLIGNNEIDPIIEWTPLDAKNEDLDNKKKAILEKFTKEYKVD